MRLRALARGALAEALTRARFAGEASARASGTKARDASASKSSRVSPASGGVTRVATSKSSSTRFPQKSIVLTRSARPSRVNASSPTYRDA